MESTARGRRTGTVPPKYNLRRKPDILSKDMIAETYKALGGDIKRKDIHRVIKEYNGIQMNHLLTERKSVQLPGIGILTPLDEHGVEYVPTLRAQWGRVDAN